MLRKLLRILKISQLIVQTLFLLSESVGNQTLLRTFVVLVCILIVEMLV